MPSNDAITEPEERRVLVVGAKSGARIDKFLEDVFELCEEEDVAVIGHHNAREYIVVPDVGGPELAHKHSETQRIFRSTKS